MPQLNLKGYGRRKPNEKSTVNPRNTEVSSQMWEIISGAHNIQRLHQTRQRILATRQWAFVWCHRRQGGDWWYLCGSIVFPVPHNENWLHANVDRDSSFYLPHHNPNPYRNHEIGLAEAYEGIGHEVIILIDDGPFH